MGPGELVEIGGRMNSERYLEVLKDVMLRIISAGRISRRTNLPGSG